MAVNYLADLGVEELAKMVVAGEQIRECYRVLRKGNTNVVAEVLKGQGDFFEWDHYPKGDVYDRETCSQYYYHAHPPETRVAIYGPENGHFHTFVRPKGMPKGIRPAPVSDYKKLDAPNDELTHLIGVSMDRQGYPIRLFTTNRWVTGETWYACEDVLRIMDVFEMDHAYPSWPVNIWITGMVRLFRPQISSLINQRDEAVADWVREKPDASPYEDRELEITSFLDVSVDKQLAAVRRALGKSQAAGKN